MYICICNVVTDRDVRKAVEQGAHSLECLQEKLAVATCCGQCAENAAACLEDFMSDTGARVAA